MSARKYCSVDEVPVHPWLLQGTIYTSSLEAKYAAAKLFCNVTGVVVKRVKIGWALLWWRRSSSI